MSSTTVEGSRTSGFAQAGPALRARMRRRCIPGTLRPLAVRRGWSALIALLACTSPGTTPDVQADSAPGVSAPADSAGAGAPPAPQQEPDTALAADVPRDTFFESSESVWLEARNRGVEFRAIGQEPGWLVEIGSERLTVLANYAADTITADVPTPVIDSLTWTTTYRVRTDTDNVRIDIRDEPCADTMSGERFSATVTLVLNGTTYHGCGRSLDELPL